MKKLIDCINEKLILSKNRDNIDFVDLGLPSGTLWAVANVGAEEPWKYGDYFAWGEVVPRKNFKYKDYKFFKDGSYTKYNETDGKTVLDIVNDAAHKHCISDSCLPTPEQCEELITNVKYKWVEKYKDRRVYGFLFTANNGNELFIPAAGYYGTFGLDEIGEYFIIPTNTLKAQNESSEYFITFTNSNGIQGKSKNKIEKGGLSRYCGCAIRPVKRVKTQPVNPSELKF